MQFTSSELQTLARACDLAYRRKDLELRRVRRNKELIENSYRVMADAGLAEEDGMETFDEQVDSAKSGKSEFLQLKKKVMYLLRGM